MRNTDHPQIPSFANIQSVTIKMIPHKDQRYPTCGDWIWDPYAHNLEIRVSQTEDWREALAVAVHELVEASLCLQRQVDPHAVDSFDVWFEKNRGVYNFDGEPGDDQRAPYYKEHQAATSIEHIFAREIGLDFKVYDKHLDDLDKEPEPCEPS